MPRFSDPLDEASQLQEEELQRAVDQARLTTPRRLPYTGECHNCGEPLPDPQRFCDAECTEEHAYVEARNRANGPAR